MSKHSVISKPRIETYRGKAGPCGVEVNTRFRDNGKLGHSLGLVAVNLRGGLMDPGSASWEAFAEELYDYGKGNFVVSTVGTNYPKLDVVRMAKGLKDGRHARAVSAYRAIIHVNSKFRPSVALQVGQSEAGITMLDGTRYWLAHRDRFFQPGKTGVMTLDSPMKHEPVDSPLEVVKILAELGAHCVPDALKLGLGKQLKISKAQRRHKNSVWDLAYGAAEIRYLSKGLDLTEDINLLQDSGIPVWHGSHTEDVVGNTEIAMDHTRRFPGGHLTFMNESTPVIEYIGSIVEELEQAARHSHRAAA